jgi:hypothetical protein
MAVLIKLALTKLRCLEETDEVGDDEPYLLVAGVNLKATPAQVETVLYGPWADIEAGDTAPTKPLVAGFDPDTIPFIVWRRLCWGLNGNPAPLAAPADVAFLVGMMEHDDGSAKAARQLAKTAVIGSLAASIGMDRATRVAKARKDMGDALKVPTGAPNFDDRVGGVQELVLHTSDLAVAAAKGALTKSLLFVGDGGKYQAIFEIAKG